MRDSIPNPSGGPLRPAGRAVSWRAVPVVLLVAGLCCSVVSAAPVAPVVEGVYSDADFQTVLPGRPEPAEPTGPAPEHRFEPEPDVGADARDGAPLLPSAGPVLRLIGWLVLVAAAIVPVVWIVSRMATGRRPPPPVAAAPAPDRDGADTAPGPDTAGALAAEGRYGEAIHALLLAALDELGRQAGALPASATGREAARHAAAPPPAAEALGSLVAAVEHSRFGVRRVDQSDWERCRGAYARFAAAWPEQR